MADLALITQAIASLQSAGQLAKALIGLRDQAMIDTKVIELRDNLIEAQSNVFQAQAQQAVLIQRVSDLEKELMRFKTWEKEKERYQLVSILSASGTAYALKESCKGAEPPIGYVQNATRMDAVRIFSLNMIRVVSPFLSALHVKQTSNQSILHLPPAEYAKDEVKDTNGL